MVRSFRFLLLVSLCALLVACGGQRESAADSSDGGEEKVLNVFNWVDYIAPSTIADFEARTGIKVIYDVYESNEMLEAVTLAELAAGPHATTDRAERGRRQDRRNRARPAHIHPQS